MSSTGVGCRRAFDRQHCGIGGTVRMPDRGSEWECPWANWSLVLLLVNVIQNLGFEDGDELLEHAVPMGKRLPEPKVRVEKRPVFPSSVSTITLAGGGLMQRPDRPRPE